MEKKMMEEQDTDPGATVSKRNKQREKERE